jgi:carboxyl-terminal processing protease
MSKLRMRSKAILVTSVLATALVSGGWLMQLGFGRRTPHVYNRARLFDQVMDYVSRSYVERLPDADLYVKATRGVLRELHDPYSVYLTSERLARLTETTAGRYQGIGVELDVRDGSVSVVAPLPGTPADHAGVEAGDRIVAIDGKPTRGWSPEEALRALRGAPGTVVRLVIERAGVDEPIPFVVARREIQFHPVQNALVLTDGVGYVNLVSFSEASATELRRAVDSLRRAGARSLVVDVRGNPGGLLEQGVAVTDLFLDQGLEIVAMRGRAREASQTFKDQAPQLFSGLPMAVLVDSASASAAEIFAGALQDHDRAIVVGTTTYGKGSAQSVFPLVDGGAMKLTTALWYTPLGRSITRPRAAFGDEEDEESSSFITDTTRERPTFRTPGGRTVYGGGGVSPDVAAPFDTPSAHERALERALGKRIPQFRQVVTAYVRSLRGRHGIVAPDFVVTAAMLDELYETMRQRDILVERPIYDAAAPVVSELLGYETTRVLFGRGAEFRRRLAADQGVAVERSRRGFHLPRFGIDRGDLSLDEAHAAQIGERPCSVGQRPRPGEVPQLGEPHREAVIARDQDDVVVGV